MGVLDITVEMAHDVGGDPRPLGEVLDSMTERHQDRRMAVCTTPALRGSATMTDVPEAFTARDIWKDFLDRQAFEHQLIDRKTGWMLSSQSIMFAAYALVVGPDASSAELMFLLVLPILGLFLSILWWFGIERLISSKRMSWKSYKRYFATHPELHLPEPCFGYQSNAPDESELQWGVETTNTERSLLPERVLPLLIGAGWLVLLTGAFLV